jgi:hypothetical protein
MLRMASGETYTSWRSRSYYNPWKFFDEDLIHHRNEFIKHFLSATAPSTTTTATPSSHSKESEENSCAVDGKDNVSAVCKEAAALKEEETLAELFWKMWKEKKYTMPPSKENSYCYVFELISPAVGINIVSLDSLQGDLILTAVMYVYTLTMH